MASSKKLAVTADELTVEKKPNVAGDGQVDLQKTLQTLQNEVNQTLGSTAGADEVTQKVIINRPDAMTLDQALMKQAPEAAAAAIAKAQEFATIPGDVKSQFDQLADAMATVEGPRRSTVVGYGQGQLAYSGDILSIPNKLYPQGGKEIQRKRADNILYALFGGDQEKKQGRAARVQMAAAKEGFAKTFLWVSQKVWFFYATTELGAITDKSRQFVEEIDASSASPIVKALNLCFAPAEVRSLCRDAKYKNCAVTDVLWTVVEHFVLEKEEDQQGAA